MSISSDAKLSGAMPLAPPIPFRPEFEHPEKDEAETTAEMIETLKKIADTTYEDTGRPLRSVHAKSHGFLRGRG